MEARDAYVATHGDHYVPVDLDRPDAYSPHRRPCTCADSGARAVGRSCQRVENRSWWAGPVFAATAGFLVGFIPAVVVLLSLGGLDPAHNLGISDAVLNLVLVVSGGITAGLAAGLAARSSPLRVARTAAVAAVVGGAAVILCSATFGAATGSAGACLWTGVLLAATAAGITARLPRRPAVTEAA